MKCYSHNENMGKCAKQCNFCKSRYKTISAREIPKASIPKKSPYKQITIRLPNDLYKKLVDLSNIDNRTIANCLETLIKNEVDDLGYDFSTAIKFWSRSQKSNIKDE